MADPVRSVQNKMTDAVETDADQGDRCSKIVADRDDGRGKIERNKRTGGATVTQNESMEPVALAQDEMAKCVHSKMKRTCKSRVAAKDPPSAST